jgi:hypothetical protein
MLQTQLSGGFLVIAFAWLLLIAIPTIALIFRGWRSGGAMRLGAYLLFAYALAPFVLTAVSSETRDVEEIFVMAMVISAVSLVPLAVAATLGKQLWRQLRNARGGIGG